MIKIIDVIGNILCWFEFMTFRCLYCPHVSLKIVTKDTVKIRISVKCVIKLNAYCCISTCIYFIKTSSFAYNFSMFLDYETIYLSKVWSRWNKLLWAFLQFRERFLSKYQPNPFSVALMPKKTELKKLLLRSNNQCTF